MKKRLVVGLSGASGAILCVSLLEAMRKEKDWEVHLVASEAGERVLREETGMSGTDLAGLAFRTHDIGNIGAAIAIAGVVLVVLNGQMSFHLNPLGDLIARETSPGPDEVVLSQEDRDRLDTMLENLDERSADVVRRRYGLVDGRQAKLADIGQVWGITAERVRQIERHAIAKLRQSSTLAA